MRLTIHLRKYTILVSSGKEVHNVGLFGFGKKEEMPSDLNERGTAAYQKGDYVQALDYFTKAAEQGYAEAQVNCGLMFEQGKGVSADYKEARMWYEKAAKQNCPEAMLCCGVMYYNDIEMRQSRAWLEKAATQTENEEVQQIAEKYLRNYFK